ncbi:MAG TPA: rhomboid family intramembrane serine protease, partial [Candidatus Binataceae bacterium]|nr:rhomboid family intramembrane serine protease [Candidatus Binataceae bacterium]
MIPLRDNQARRRLTLINVTLIAVNVAVFIHEAALGNRLNGFIYQYAMIPAHVTSALEGGRELARYTHDAASTPALATILTSMFLHGGLMHIAGNMLYLFIFGAAVEEAMGHVRFLLFYLLSGVAAALAMAAFMPHSTVPVIGASGAIAGVLGAYFVLYPRAKITTILPIFVLMYFVEVPAILYLLLWFVAQLYAGLTENPEVSGGVAWWAHVGGFLVGMVVGPMLAT